MLPDLRTSSLSTDVYLKLKFVKKQLQELIIFYYISFKVAKKSKVNIRKIHSFSVFTKYDEAAARFVRDDTFL